MSTYNFKPQLGYFDFANACKYIRCREPLVARDHIPFPFLHPTVSSPSLGDETYILFYFISILSVYFIKNYGD